MPRCNTGNGLDLTIAFSETATGGTVAQDLTDLGTLVDSFVVESASAMNVTVSVTDQPNVSDPVGSFVKKCFGDRRDHSPWTVTITHDPSDDLASLIGALASSITLTWSDGSSVSGSGAIVGGQVITDTSGDGFLSSTLTIQYDGYTGPAHATS